jgi:hypothetical protein
MSTSGGRAHWEYPCVLQSYEKIVMCLWAQLLCATVAYVPQYNKPKILPVHVPSGLHKEMARHPEISEDCQDKSRAVTITN